MKTRLLLFLSLLLSTLAYSQIPTANLAKEYLLNNGSSQNNVTPGSGDLIPTGSARTSVLDFLEVTDNAMMLNGDSFDSGVRSANYQEDLTLSFWLKTSTVDPTGQIIIQQYSSSAFGYYGWYVELVNGKVRVTSNIFNGSVILPIILESTDVIADDRWHHIVFSAYEHQKPGFIARGYTRHLYVDNILQGSGENFFSGTVPPVLNKFTEPVLIAPGGNFTDAIDNVRIYNRILWGAELTPLYNEFYNTLSQFYVDINATGDNNGSSWKNAYTDLQSALNTVTTQLIWIAQGTYTPHSSNRTATFSIPNGIGLFGGFNGTETLLTERDFINNKTILSGDLLGNDTGTLSYSEASRSDNSYHIVTLNGHSTGLDGLTISGGHANGGSGNNVGAAILKGYAFAYINLKNSIIENNVATFAGAGIFGRFDGGGTTDVTVENTVFNNNLALLGAGYYGYKGGAGNMNMKFVNTVFSNNKTVDNGAGTAYAGSAIIHRTLRASYVTNLDIINCTFANNEDLGTHATMSSSNRSVIGVSQYPFSTMNAKIYNSIFWGNTEVAGATSKAIHSYFEDPPALVEASNSIDEEGFSYVVSPTNTSSTDPLFNDANNGDFSLNCSSPGVDAGDATGLTLPATDVIGNNRTVTTIDMGAFELNTVYASITAVAKDITLSLDATGSVTILPEAVDNNSGSVCGTAFTLILDKTTFTCADLGANTVTLTATETVGGASNNTTATVTIIDDSSPVALIQDITVQLDATGNAIITSADVNNSSSDNCTATGSLVLSLDITTFTCADIGANTVVLTITDANGNSSTASATVTVADGIAPTAGAQNISVQIDAGTGIALITPAMIDNGSSDNCSGGLSLSLSKTEFTCADTGANVIILMVEDAAGNQSTANATVTVTSIINDESVAISDMTICTGGGTTTVTTGSSVNGVKYYLRNNSNDAIINGPITGQGTGMSFSTGIVNATTTFNVYGETFPSLNYALDFDGINDHIVTPIPSNFDYTSSYTLETWVKSPLPGASGGYPSPLFVGNTVGSDIEVYVQQGTNKLFVVHNRGNGGTLDYGEFPSPPNNVWYHLAVVYNGSNVQVFYDGVSKGIFAIGTPLTSANAQINIGYIASSAFNVPNKNLNGQLDDYRLWSTARTVANILANKDNCLSGNEASLETYYQFEDASGLIATDLVNSNDGILTNMNGSSDWVTGATISCGQICGFEMTQTVTVSIGDAINPTAIAQNITVQLNSDGGATITAADINNGSTDNCTASGSLVFSLDKLVFTCADLGANTVTLSVEDASTNLSTATATVTVVDGVVPNALTQDITVQLDASGDASITSADINLGSIDNCTAVNNLTLSIDQTAFTCADLGANTVTLTVEDASGNQSSATATVTIVDGLVPTPVSQNITVQLDATGNATIDGSDVNNGSSDNCTAGSNLVFTLSQSAFDCTDLGANNITFTVEDASGNQFSTGATITVEDNIAPTVVTQDIFVGLDGNPSVTIAAQDVDGGSSDACGTLSYSVDISTFTTADLGANTVTLTVSDGNGNSSFATATVTVTEKQNQTITFPSIADKTYGNNSFVVSASASSGLSVSYSLISGPATLAGDMVSITGIGNILVEASQAGDNDYTPAPQKQLTIVVNKASLTATADDKTIGYGDALPTLTATYTGFVNGESSSDLTTEPTASTTATVNSDTGLYPVILSGGSADNYSFILVDGNLEINKANQSLTIEAIANQDFTQVTQVTVSSQANSGLTTTLSVTGPATISGNMITLDGTSGTITVTASQSGSLNYNAATDATISFDSFDGSNPCLTFAVSLTTTTNNTCNGASEGAIDITATGGDGNYSYAWSNNTGSEDASTLAAGTYTVTVTDGNNCSVTLTETITEPNLIEIEATTTDVVAGNDGTADITATGGTGAYTYSWSNGDTTEDLANVAAGNYTVTVTDANGCSVSQAIAIGDIITAVDELTTSTLQVYPNPVTDYMTVEGEFTQGKVEVQIINSNGQQMMQKQFDNVTNNKVQLHLTSIKNGQYLVLIKANNQQTVQRINIKH